MPQWRLATDIGICPTTFSHYVMGHTSVPLDVIKKVAKRLCVDRYTLVEVDVEILPPLEEGGEENV